MFIFVSNYRILFKFNTTEFLNVFSMAFSDHRFTSQQKQRICCILSSLTTNSKDLKVNISIFSIFQIINYLMKIIYIFSPIN